ncbi:MAG TPA: cation transporter [Microlunatus sp.]|nr:cation transporter [Microlunatus sp.]
MSEPAFGRTTLPEPQADALRRAVRLEWITLAFLAGAITLVGLVLGNSQAMKAAWIEDLLSVLPPISFLLAVRLVSRPPSVDRPYGFHRSIGAAHLVSGTALLIMGGFLVVDSSIGLISAEHPAIGSVAIGGQLIWLGWLMIGAMVITGVPPVLLGRAKMKLAETLHDKVLYADADMNKADWLTALGSIIGVMGIGLGLWWTDAVAALFIAATIVSDGIKNLRSAVRDLMDARPTTYDNARPHPVLPQVVALLRKLDWVRDAGVRARDEGHVFHVEAFVVPASTPTVAMLEEARRRCIALDWRLEDVVVIPVDELSPIVDTRSEEHADT